MNTGASSILLALGLVAVASPGAAQSKAAALRQAMLVAEDGRSRRTEDRAPLLTGLKSADPALVAVAARGLGRLEDPTLVEVLLPLLTDGRVPVREAAAHALGQAAEGLRRDSSGQLDRIWSALRDSLLAKSRTERDPRGLGALARTLGRLPYRSPAEFETARTRLGEILRGSSNPALTLDAVKGLESLLRLAAASPQPIPPAPEIGATLGTVLGSPAAVRTPEIRRLALAALLASGQLDRRLIEAALADGDPGVRRLGALALGTAKDGTDPGTLLRRGVADPDPMVRLEALRSWGRVVQNKDCGPIIKAVHDPNPHVALLALDLLGNPCPSSSGAADVLFPIVDSLAGIHRGALSTLASWHRGAHALVSLARIAPTRVQGLLTRAAANSTWQVRMYAARAAAAVGDVERLLLLEEDLSDNVREAALTGLKTVRGHAADSFYLAALGRSDYQLVLTAASALAGTPSPGRAVPVLFRALARITAEQRETSRDPRVAILTRLGEFGTADLAPSLEPYLQDFDPVVAGLAAEYLTRWTGRPRTAAPRLLLKPPLKWSEIQALRGARLRVTMAVSSGSGRFEIALFPDEAPATVARVVRLARAGYYNGLTFHRVVPNFVIQGGSPNANEYTGDALFMRDEVGPVSHNRGTLGISTRGRDTGDAQIFVNLVDNPRLDFNYTVWGRVVSGMEVVDGVLEGDVIERVEVVK